MKQASGRTGLIRLIRQAIEESGALPFDQYMKLCLYHDRYGYYHSPKPKIGREGDFYTSSYVGSVMGEMLAAFLLRHGWGRSGRLHVVEWGGGTGRMARHVLDALQKEDAAVYDRLLYHCVEESPSHRRLQADECRNHLEKMQWLGEQEFLQEASALEEPVVLFSNELLDAFPVKRAVCRDGTWKEVFVGWDDRRGAFFEVEQTPEKELADYLDAHGVKGEDGQRMEANLAGLAWFVRTAGALPPGSWMISIDYGDVREALWSGYRRNGTFRCYHRHRVHDDPYVHVGEQDMTAHVNFSDFMEAGERAGLETVRYCTQKEFLLAAGILDRLVHSGVQDPFHPDARRNRAIRQLLLDDSMGESFKVLIQQKRGG